MANYYWIISYEKENQNLNICHYIYCRISNQCPNKDYVMYDYIEFPKSNHGMYNDLDKLQEFLDKSLEYARVYFTN